MGAVASKVIATVADKRLLDLWIVSWRFILNIIINFWPKYRKGKVRLTFKVCKSVHHHSIQINQQLDATVSQVYYPDVYLQLNMFRTSSRPSSGAQRLQ